MNLQEQYLKDLEQAKKRNHKIYITDIAISKVPRTGIYNFSNEQNKVIQDYHKEILKRSKTYNDSNEVAVTIRLDLMDSKYDVWLNGTEKEVIFEGTEAENRIRFSPYRTVLVMHNHPSTQNLSYSDIMLFANNMSIYGITVVTNTGETHILCKTEKFRYELLREFNELVKRDALKKYEDIKDNEYKNAVIQEILAKQIIKYADQLGLYYRHGGGKNGK